MPVPSGDHGNKIWKEFGPKNRDFPGKFEFRSRRKPRKHDISREKPETTILKTAKTSGKWAFFSGRVFSKNGILEKIREPFRAWIGEPELFAFGGG
jgi:hypothetical protein